MEAIEWIRTKGTKQSRIRSYERSIRISFTTNATKTRKMLLTEIDKYKTRYSGVFSRQTILDTLEATRDKLRRYNELSPIEQLKQDHTEEVL